MASHLHTATVEVHGLAYTAIAARARVEELQGQIDELKQQLTAAKEGLTRLRITRETGDEVPADPGPDADVDADVDADEAGEAIEPTAPGAGSVIGVPTVRRGGPACTRRRCRRPIRTCWKS
jgi:hypothetical protein